MSRISGCFSVNAIYIFGALIPFVGAAVVGVQLASIYSFLQRVRAAVGLALWGALVVSTSTTLLSHTFCRGSQSSIRCCAAEYSGESVR